MSEWSIEEKLVVWDRGEQVSDRDPNVWRKDECGAWIKHSDYGNQDSMYGWQIDHITSQDHGGSDAPSNLRPLHWRNNLSKGEGRLKCSVRAVGEHNIITI